MAVSGVFHFGGAVLVGRLMQLGAFATLAHELSPAQMGVVALLTATFIGLYSLTNFGFDRYLIYSDGKSLENMSLAVNVVWSMQLLRGFGVFLLSYLIAFWANSFTSFSVDVLYFLGIGLALLVFNFMNPHVVIYERGGDFNYSARLKGYSTTISGFSTMLLVLTWNDPGAYVVGQVINTSIYTLLTYKYSKTLPRISFDKKVSIEVFSYCKHLLLMATVSFAAVQFENFYIGFIFGPSILGLYFTWARVVQLPREVVLQFIDRILFSQACNLKRESGDFSRLHLIGLTASLMMVAPFYVFVWNHGDWLVGMVAGSAWIEYWWAGKYFIVISFFYLLSSTIGPFTLSCFPKFASRLRAAESLGLVLLMVWLGQVKGVEGVLDAALLSIVIATLFRIYILYRKIIMSDKIMHVIHSLAITALVFVPLLSGEYFLAGSNDDISSNYALFSFYFLFYLLVGFVAVFFRKKMFN